MKSILTREKYKKTGEKGITLIALVVTIIVLLILAGVSIMMLTGQNGILRRAEESSTRTAHSEVYEMLNLETVDYLVESKLGNYSGTLIDYLKDEKNYIYEKEGIDGYIIDVEKLLGAKGKYGNGTDGIKDVYKLEEVTTEGNITKVATTKVAAIEDKKTGKKYEVIYYGTTEKEKVSLGYLQDEEINTAKDPESDEPKPEDIFTYSLNEDNTITITGIKNEYHSGYYVYWWNSEDETVDILIYPSQIDGKDVTCINWNYPPNLARKVVLPDTLKELKCKNFEFYWQGSGYDRTEEIVFPNSLTSIGNGVFDNCNSIKKIYYRGTPEQWEDISIGSNNSILNSAEKVYNYTGN